MLTWLLEHHRRTLMVIMIGVLLGALRALWPWQDDARGVLAPDPGWWWMLLPAAAGAAVVLAIMAAERRMEGAGPTPSPAGTAADAPGADPEATVVHRVTPPAPGTGPRPGGPPDADATRPLPRVPPHHRDTP